MTVKPAVKLEIDITSDDVEFLFDGDGDYESPETPTQLAREFIDFLNEKRQHFDLKEFILEQLSERYLSDFEEKIREDNEPSDPIDS